MSFNADVAILGGGPAGATAALLLASWGQSVRLVTRPAVEKRLAVSLPPSCAKLFDAIGISGAINACGFMRSAGNTVWWGSAAARVESFAAGAHGWQLEVDQLASVLRVCAASAGARIDRLIASADVTASMVLDCTGRSGVVARANDVRRYHDGPRTVALIGEWRCEAACRVPDDSHTLIESYEDGWMWSVPLSNGVRHIAAMVDPLRSGLARGGSATDVYRAEIAKTREFRRLTEAATMIGEPRGWDASQYHSTNYSGDGWMLVGDAGSFIDPLSSAGVKKALASGWLAAIAAHTWLKSPSMRSHALGFFDAREREIAQQVAQQSRRFLADAATGHHHAFWTDRSDEGDESVPDGAAVRQVFERLKASETWSPRVGDTVAIEPRPCIRGNEIVLEPHIVTPDESGGVRYVRAIDVVALVQMAPATRQVPDLFDQYVKRIGPTPLPEFLFAVATSVARGWLVAE
jgi:flavin-dependent dehydrogenase